jgi:hypothetical protein
MCHLLLVGWITFVLLLGSCLLVYGQTTAILSGNMTDATIGKPMPFAHVYVNGSTQSAITDEKGDYIMVTLKNQLKSRRVSFRVFQAISSQSMPGGDSWLEIVNTLIRSYCNQPPPGEFYKAKVKCHGKKSSRDTVKQYRPHDKVLSFINASANYQGSHAYS